MLMYRPWGDLQCSIAELSLEHPRMTSYLLLDYDLDLFLEAFPTKAFPFGFYIQQ